MIATNSFVFVSLSEVYSIDYRNLAVVRAFVVLKYAENGK